MSRRVPLILIVVLSATAAGCLHGDVPTPAAQGPADAHADGVAYAPNLWLLGGPGPVHTSDVSSGAEPTIHADVQREFLFIGDTSGGYRSADNGTSWTRMANPFLITADGWDFAQDNDGTLYAVTTSIPYIDVARSTNDGTSWGVSRVVGAAPIADRPWIASDGEGTVALVYWAYPAYETCTISYDGATTWPDRSLTSGSPNAGNLVYDNGHFYWTDDDGTLHRIRLNALGAPISCLQGHFSRPFNDGPVGTNVFVPTAAENGSVFIAYPNANNDALVLAGATSFDGTPKYVTVNPPVLRSNTFPAIDVQGGRLVVAWYGSETDGTISSTAFSGAWNVYVAVVDGFFTDNPTTSYHRLTDEPNHIGNICVSGTGCSGNQDRDLLDYFDIEQDAWGGIHVAYVHDGASSDARVRYARLDASTPTALAEPVPLP